MSWLFLASSNEDAKRLFDDLMKDYNKLLRPVQKPLQKLRISMKLKLSQIIKVVRKIGSISKE